MNNDLFLEASRKLNEAAELLKAACGECSHAKAKASGPRLMGQKTVNMECPDCGHHWTTTSLELRPGPTETLTFVPGGD